MIVRVLSQKVFPSQAVHQIAQEAFEHGSPWTLAQFEDLINQPYVLALGAFEGENLVGFLMASLIPPEAEIYNIAVDKTYQNQGVGHLLLEELTRNLLVNGIQDLFLEVRAGNQAGIAFYSKHGFELMGMRKKYYTRPTEDALVLKLSLASRE